MKKSRRSAATVATLGAKFVRVQPALAFAVAHLHEDVPLAALAAETGLSPFHLHRVFSSVTGETPKQFTLRLRLSRGAAILLTRNDSVLRVAQCCGFRSHEAFTRAFRRQFGTSPRAYRQRGLTRHNGPPERRTHAAVVHYIAPCVGLYHLDWHTSSERNDMSYSVVRKNLAPQPVLVVRRRVKRSEVAATIGSVLPHIFHYAQQHGLTLEGHPLTRYSNPGLGLFTIEPGFRISDADYTVRTREHADKTASGFVVIEELLPGGPAATTIHVGPYDKLGEAYAALESWIESEQLQPAGAPWEYYITDPAEYPDPKDWKTEVFWPIDEEPLV
jgi:AraC family transcriptional regulator